MQAFFRAAQEEPPFSSLGAEKIWGWRNEVTLLLEGKMKRIITLVFLTVITLASLGGCYPLWWGPDHWGGRGGGHDRGGGHHDRGDGHHDRGHERRY